MYLLTIIGSVISIIIKFQKGNQWICHDYSSFISFFFFCIFHPCRTCHSLPVQLCPQCVPAFLRHLTSLHTCSQLPHQLRSKYTCPFAIALYQIIYFAVPAVLLKAKLRAETISCPTTAGCSDCVQPREVLSSQWSYQVWYHHAKIKTCTHWLYLATCAVAQKYWADRLIWIFSLNFW